MKNIMNKITQFDDLSNELFLEILDYLHALDIFMAFTSLNHRISTILSLTQLHIVISELHCQHQVKFLSSHLFYYAHQVISVSIQDQLRDFPSAICFIFNHHTFENLRSCKFYSIHPSSNFGNVIRKLKNLHKLVSFRIIHSKDVSLPDTIKQDFIKTILTHQSIELRSIRLNFYYDYPKLLANIVINSTVTSLHMIFHGSTVPCSIYSLLPILRHYRSLRMLRIIISNDNNSNTQQTMLPTLPDTYETNPPILPSIKTFDLYIRTFCDFRSLNFILHCMPNLRQFIMTIVYSSTISPLRRDIFDGHKWQQLLTNNTSHLDVFDIFLLTQGLNLIPDINITLKSFDYFARKYDQWYVAIHRSRLRYNSQEQQISLRGCTHSKTTRLYNIGRARMVLGTLNVHSTTIKDAQHHLFYSHYKDLRINIPVNKKILGTLSSGQLFQNIDYLTIEMDSSMLTFWEDMLDLFNIRCNIVEINQNERADQLSKLINLTNITKLQILPKNDISHLYFIKEILLASSRLIQLKIGNPLIFSSILYNNSSLIPIFDQLQSLYLLTEHVYFPIEYATKLIERFPSLIHLELEIYSLDMCIPLLNILLDGLPKLIHLKIHFYENKLLADGTCLINHLIQRRRQIFPHNLVNKDEVSIKIDRQIMDIYLSGCPICADIKYCF